MKLATSILIVPPHEVQAIAAPILQQYGDDNLIRVPAHITVLFPFVTYEQLDAACTKLVTICQSIVLFDITMKGYGRFPGVAFMKPEDPRPIQAVYQRIHEAFPDCKLYGGEFGDELYPHMTVGEFDTQAEQEAAVLPDYEPISFRCERLHVMYGVHQEPLPWITHAVIRLGG